MGEINWKYQIEWRGKDKDHDCRASTVAYVKEDWTRWVAAN